ncbi:MAG TPA: WhiB family transcriptional regulator [Pseudonocardiaceae bacterium]|nr:WhiB family transcriptional regulator [Pseudonocardiaceae bacterium]
MTAIRTIRLEYHPGRWHRDGHTKTCRHCGDTYRRPANQSSNDWNRRLYCSMSCASTASAPARLAGRGRTPRAEPVATVPAPTDSTWLDHAACRDASDTDRFVPDNPGAHWRPPPECGRCPVRAECLAYGLATKSIGVWGGQYLRGAWRKKGAAK